MLPLGWRDPRLPCFTTPVPAAATANDAAVDTLNRSNPLPPVPARSTPVPRISSGAAVARSRMARANPTTSVTDSPFSASASSRAATWSTSSASVANTASAHACASSTVRSVPACAAATYCSNFPLMVAYRSPTRRPTATPTFLDRRPGVLLTLTPCDPRRIRAIEDNRQKHHRPDTMLERIER